MAPQQEVPRRSTFKTVLSLLTVIASVLAGIICLSNTGSAQDLGFQRRVKEGHRKLESFLAGLEKEHRKGPLFSQQFARERIVGLDDQDNVIVFLISERGREIDVESLRALGVEILKGTKDVIKAKVPVSLLGTIADTVEGISFIKLPDRPEILGTSQGVSLTQALSYYLSGYTGQDVKVAVIDIGFAGVSEAISRGELPGSVIRVDCTGTSCAPTTFPSESESHGTGVAEIIHDMAPGAQLYLIKIDDSADLVDAKNYCINNGIKIINHSVGWYNGNFYSGECYFTNPVCTANDAYAHGVLWVNAAGNSAKQHYGAVFTDSNGDSWHDQLTSLNVSAGETIRLYLTWDAWPFTNQDYDLLLLDPSFNIVASSETQQTGIQPPVERVLYSVPTTGTYYIAIGKYSATLNHRLQIFSSHNLSPYVSSGSITSPADAETAIAVGAINQGSWPAGPHESFSSQGPTGDGRIKPEISGPDGVSNSVYPGGFYGTSAAAPHVAGAAALILSKNPGYPVSQLRAAVTLSAIDLGSPGLDTVYGYGRLSLPSTFLDVSFEHWAHDYIKALYESGITGGCSADPMLFCPDRGITRAEMAAFIETSLGNPPDACAGSLFTDVNGATVGSAFCGFIETLAADGVTDGCTSTRFCPNDTISRAQVAVFIEAALRNQPNPCTGSLFTDVSATSVGSAFCGFIERLADDGITGGCTASAFCPNNPVTRAQMAVFLGVAPPPLNP